MKQETLLLAELNRLVDLGETLLTVFPKMYPDYWELQLPDSVSHEMWVYAKEVAWRATRNRAYYQASWRQCSTDYLAKRVKDCRAGLLGWRAIGVLK